jgi:hypothetical protein
MRMPLFHEAQPVKDGNLVLRDKPGLGLGLDEAALRGGLEIALSTVRRRVRCRSSPVTT